jgi:hypothetical protein
MKKHRLVLALLGLLLAVCVPMAAASDTQWSIQLGLYNGAVGGSPQDTIEYMGVRPGATDGYDALDSPKPGTPPTGSNYVRLCWYRGTWPDPSREYITDWHAPIADVAPCNGLWSDLRATSNVAGNKTLGWTR